MGDASQKYAQRQYRRLRRKDLESLSYDCDRAITEFRSFYPLALLHAGRIDNPAAIEEAELMLLEILAELKKRKMALNPES